MGTWDVGPFDNDTAADSCASLEEAAEADRRGLIRDTPERQHTARHPLPPVTLRVPFTKSLTTTAAAS
ncbi:DUF4259 domain-containing protein [Streptomyces sp. ISL-43]|uniref:DUF4259 domain-containing protein n=1 Tax=Streptomyces sp. ISL-43 TaxID=2819183 RepID=UPI001BE8033E|nr:DUF4259 domain-containing protein [Streptomyces sp. ISL-43]MBT2451444.1 DUF4259 domain-containing protein [Streptomyces sp. ISL-43]